jgi:type IV secretory pathway TrbL component
MPLKVDADLLTAALIGCQAELQDIEARMAELRNRIGAHPASLASAGGTATKRVLSAAARRRMAAAQRKRWAAVRKAKTEGAVKPAVAKAAPKRRRLSPEGRARIVAANRKRWAARKAEAKAAAKSAAR